MVLRHLGPPSTTVTTTTSHEELTHDDDRGGAPMDLSNKHHSVLPEIPRHHHPLNHRNQFLSSILPRPFSSPRTPPSHLHNNSYNNILNNNNNNNNEPKSNSPQSSNSEENSPRGKGDVWRLRRKDLSKSSRWRDGGGGGSGGGRMANNNEDDISNSHSSPDSGLHRDSPGEDEDLMMMSSHSTATTPPLRKQGQHLIPLSIIRARYPQPMEGGGNLSQEDEDNNSSTTKKKDKVLTKRARLEEMVTHIKSSKDRSRRNSGDDDTSSGGHATSSDEIIDDGSREAVLQSYHQPFLNNKGNIGCLNLKRTNLHHDADMMIMDDEPCNLVCSEGRGRPEDEDEEEEDHLQYNGWVKNANNNKINSSSSPQNNNNKPSPDSLSTTEAAKLLGLDPETYQQQMVQLQLTSAAMLGGDPTGMLKGMGNYPPWVYLGYYSQILQSFQAQEILRQYAMQSNNPLTPNVSQGEKVCRLTSFFLMITFTHNFLSHFEGEKLGSECNWRLSLFAES